MPSSLSAIFARNRCAHFEMVSWVEAGHEEPSAVLQFIEWANSRMSVPAGTRGAHFESAQSVENDFYRLQGHIVCDDDWQIVVALTVDKLGGEYRPPRGSPSIHRFLQGARSLLGEQSFRCDIVLEYPRDQGVRQFFPLPVALMNPGPAGITHIESAMFSKRSDDEREFTIHVFPPDDDDPLTHIVSFEENCVLSRASIGRVVDKAQTLSSALLVPDAGESNA